MAHPHNEMPVVMVTGAAAGIGRACCERFLRAGYRVAMLDIDERALLETRKELDYSGCCTLALQADVTDEDRMTESVAHIAEVWGRLDAAYNNAGVTSSGPLTHDLEKSAWDKTIGIDLTGVWLCMKAQIAFMLDHGGGSIVNAASIAGHIGYREASAYAAAKHGVVGLTKTAAVEFASRGVRVNAVSPGPVQSEMLEQSFERRGAETREWYLANTPMGRFAKFEEIANSVLWLASDESSFVTGHCLAVDGGWTAH